MASNRRPVLKLGVVDFGVETATLPGGVQVDLPVIRHPGALLPRSPAGMH